MNKKRIVQIIPCVEPVVAIYDCSGELTEEDISYLALCDNGSIEPISLSDGCYDMVKAGNFIGLFSKKDNWRPVDESEYEKICDTLGINQER